MNAQAVLLALQVAQPSIRGVVIRDLNDPMTWTFDGATDAAAAIAIVQAELDAETPQGQAAAALDRDAALKQVVTTVAYIWRVTHGNTNPTVPQLKVAMDVWKAIYSALP